LIRVFGSYGESEWAAAHNGRTSDRVYRWFDAVLSLVTDSIECCAFVTVMILWMALSEAVDEQGLSSGLLKYEVRLPTS